jgi:3-oxoacyl-[acyl-carrier protein] reductase
MNQTVPTTPKRVALITGCGKANGIGAAIARAYAAAGITVVVSDVAVTGVQNDNAIASAINNSWRGLETLVEEITMAGGTAAMLTGDVSTEADANRLVADAVARYGQLDILVSNAGAPHGNDRGDIETIPVEAWHRVMGINALGPFLLMRAAIPHMKARRWGRIITMSSVAGLAPLQQRAIYSASKAAVIGMTRSVAFDVAPYGITVNAICPGSIRTDRAISTTLRAGWTDVDAGLKERAKVIPMQRHGKPEEVAAVAMMLASDGGGFITGQAIAIDGGGLPAGSV